MDTREFLASRAPAAPVPLMDWLAGCPLDGGAPADALLAGGLRALDASRAAPGRVRSSAFHLLAADALITYACEAALEMEDPRASLEGILHHAALARR